MIAFAVFVFGLAIGSFLNVIIYRLAVSQGVYPNFSDRKNHVMSPFRGRSFCDTCGHRLSWQDLIPLLSFLVLKGRCRYCKEKISFQYPLIELATALVFMLLVENLTESSFPQVMELLYLWVMAALLIVIFVYDLKHFLIPDKILYPAILVSGIWYLVSSILGTISIYQILNTIYSALGAAGFFLAIYLLSKGKWLGFGDVKLAFLLGLFLGWPPILVAMFFAFLIGAVFGLLLIALKKKGMKSEVPFAPFLIAGTAVAFFFGESILHWYLGLFLV